MVFVYNKLMKNKARLTTIIFIVSVSFGIFLIVAPIVIGRINQSRSNNAIRSYQNIATASDYNYEAEFERADRYNAAIAGSVKDDDILEQYNDILNVENGIMGHIEIPRIGIRDPIYHGIEEEVLQRGIGHLPNTSIPVGGLGTHAALSGHRGLPSSKLFTDLDQIRIGDIILIQIASQKLAYEVYEIETVEPDHTGGLEVDPNDDLLTLITCTPYAINSHRLLVHARRTIYKEELEQIKTEHTISESDRILIIALAIVAVILAIDIVVILCRRNREKQKTEKSQK